MKINKIFHILVACFLVLMFSCTVSAEGLSASGKPSANLSSDIAEDRLEILGNLNEQYTQLMSEVKEALSEMDESLGEMERSLSGMDVLNEILNTKEFTEENSTAVRDFEQQFQTMKEELTKLDTVYEKFEEKLEELHQSYQALQSLSEEYNQLAVLMKEESAPGKNSNVVLAVIVAILVIGVISVCVYSAWELQLLPATKKKKKTLLRDVPNRRLRQENSVPRDVPVRTSRQENPVWNNASNTATG